MLREINETEYVLTGHLQLHFMELPGLQITDSLSPLSGGCKTTGFNVGRLFFEAWQITRSMRLLLRDDMDIRKAHDEYLKFTGAESMKQKYSINQENLLKKRSLFTNQPST